jgi:hypothetical protein
LGYATEFTDEEAPTAFHVGYGLNYYLSSHWSIMPGVGYREKFEVGDATGKEECGKVFKRGTHLHYL